MKVRSEGSGTYFMQSCILGAGADICYTTGKRNKRQANDELELNCVSITNACKAEYAYEYECEDEHWACQLYGEDSERCINALSQCKEKHAQCEFDRQEALIGLKVQLPQSIKSHKLIGNELTLFGEGGSITLQRNELPKEVAEYRQNVENEVKRAEAEYREKVAKYSSVNPMEITYLPLEELL